MSDFSRRKFLRNAGLTLVAAGLPMGFSPLMAKAMVHDGVVFSASGSEKEGGEKFAVRMDLATQDMRKVPLDFLAHSFSPVPGNSMRAIAMEKWGRGAALFDFEQQKVVQNLTCPEDRAFRGHGVFSAAGDVFYATQGNFTAKSGQVTAFDTKTFEEIAYYPVVGGVHDCNLGPDNSLFVMTNVYKPDAVYPYKQEDESTPTLMQISLKDGSVMSKRPVEGIKVAHFTVGKGGTLVTMTREKMENDVQTDNVYLSDLNTLSWRKVSMTPEQRQMIRGELFSVALDEKNGIVAFAGKTMGMMVFVDIASARVTQCVKTGHINGVMYDAEKGVFVGTGKGGVFFVTPEGAWKETQFMNGGYFSHSVMI